MLAILLSALSSPALAHVITLIRIALITNVGFLFFMHYILKKTAQLKPLAFLCGPLLTDRKDDRRKILHDYLSTDEFNASPIIVDKFLKKEFIDDDSIKIPLLEEICAAASFRIYIFLDTFSSVTELGMFSHTSTRNHIVVFLPHSKDKLVENLNFFVREVIDPKNNQNVEVVYYRPRIMRVPFASDYVVEYFEFPYDRIPINIKKNIADNNEYTSYDIHISFLEAKKVNDDFQVIDYTKETNQITFFINLKMMFYLIASVAVTFNEKDPSRIITLLSTTLISSIDESSFDGEILIETKPDGNILEIIKHLIKFLDLYSEFGQAAGKKIVTKETSLIYIPSIVDFCQLSVDDWEILSNYVQINSNYVETFEIKKGSKKRKITKYKDDPLGASLRQIHSNLIKSIEKLHEFSNYSFAYRKHFSILDCVSVHLASNYFIKIDISNFFNSITFRQLYNTLKVKMADYVKIDMNFDCFVRSFLFEGSLPLGFVSSPLISDLYLSDFDRRISEWLQQNFPQVVYTRYADDIFFSSVSEIDETRYELFQTIVAEELARVKLKINEKKTRLFSLNQVGDHVKLLGLNLVKQTDHNVITVGKKYIYDTAIMLQEYIRNFNELSEEDKFYQKQIISGRVAYIKQIEGACGYQLLKTRIQISTHGRIMIPDDKIDFNNLT